MKTIKICSDNKNLNTIEDDYVFYCPFTGVNLLDSESAENLFLDKALSKDKLSNIAFGLAKASEDLGELEQSFKYYTKGNSLRKNFLNYKISEDIELFKQLKTSYSQIADNSLKTEEITNKLIPIFIIGAETLLLYDLLPMIRLAKKNSKFKV